VLAYIFWHRPYPNTERQRYEQAIARFQTDLAGSKPPGFIGATSFSDRGSALAQRPARL
jgi:hypothetical protein